MESADQPINSQIIKLTQKIYRELNYTRSITRELIREGKSIDEYE